MFTVFLQACFSKKTLLFFFFFTVTYFESTEILQTKKHNVSIKLKQLIQWNIVKLLFSSLFILNYSTVNTHVIQ